MTTVRLNKTDKDAIAMEARRQSPMHEELTELLEARYAIAERVRVHSIGGKEKAAEYDKVLKAMQKLRDTLPDNLIGYGLGIKLSGSCYVKIEHKERRILLRDNKPEAGGYIDFDPEHPIAKDLLESLDKEKKLKKQLDEIQAQVYASISSITSLNKLLKVWPESIEIIPDYLKEAKVHLPALQTNQLNKLIGLPTNKTGAKK